MKRFLYELSESWKIAVAQMRFKPDAFNAHGARGHYWIIALTLMRHR
jgi:hypothetical protein